MADKVLPEMKQVRAYMTLSHFQLLELAAEAALTYDPTDSQRYHK